MTYSKDHPFLSAIKERTRLTSVESEKETWHVVLDLKGSGLTYQPGDCVGVLPVNAPDLVQQTLEAQGFSGQEIVHDPKTGQPYALRDYLTQKANLTQLNKKVLRHLQQRQSHSAKADQLATILCDREQLQIHLDHHELWDLLLAHPEVRFTPDELVAFLPPLLPRFYSIASAQRVVGEEVHLTVRHLQYTRREIRRLGVCTHYLCHMTPLGDKSVPIFIQPAHAFGLPVAPETPLIMVGPGTGVAPYRAFLQERMALGGEGKNWLFFGEWQQQHHFYYQEFWDDLVKKGTLQLNTAFSRDQQEKVYVQHRMWEHAPEIWRWLEEGAHFCVCGDAKRMAREVEMTLKQIIETHGKLSSEAARGLIRQWRKEKRYLADVY